MRSPYALFAALVLVTVPYTAECIKCWVCHSNADPRCADPFDNTSLPIYDCDQERLVHLPDIKATMCRKIRQKVNGTWLFIRSCAFLGSPGDGNGNENYCPMRSGIYNCTCNSKDGCNTATHTKSNALALYLLGAILLVVLRFW